MCLVINSPSNLQKRNIPNERNCTIISTGAILLADIIPAFFIKLLSPFVPYHTTARITIACATAIASFLLVATASSKLMIMLGVALTSFSSGLGEPTFLYHSTYYSKDTISTWSSGTGAAGIIGALSYSVLRLIGLSSYNTLLVMIFVPIVELLVYKLVLSSPRRLIRAEGAIVDNSDENVPLMIPERVVQSTSLSFADKIAIIPHLFVYIVPLILVYFFEYFINQGLVSCSIHFCMSQIP